MNDKNGGPAFPHHVADQYGWTEGRTFAGMSLRDYFAAKAMQGMLLDDEGDFSNPVWMAEQAYKFADAMLAAREVKS